jgi:hypothetical protein
VLTLTKRRQPRFPRLIEQAATLPTFDLTAAERIGPCDAVVGHGCGVDDALDRMGIGDRRDGGLIGQVGANPGDAGAERVGIACAECAAIDGDDAMVSSDRLSDDLEAYVAHGARD